MSTSMVSTFSESKNRTIRTYHLWKCLTSSVLICMDYHFQSYIYTNYKNKNNKFIIISPILNVANFLHTSVPNIIPHSILACSPQVTALHAREELNSNATSLLVLPQFHKHEGHLLEKWQKLRQA